MVTLTAQIIDTKSIDSRLLLDGVYLVLNRFQFIVHYLLYWR